MVNRMYREEIGNAQVHVVRQPDRAVPRSTLMAATPPRARERDARRRWPGTSYMDIADGRVERCRQYELMAEEEDGGSE